MNTKPRLALTVAAGLLTSSCARFFLGSDPSPRDLKGAAGGYWEVTPRLSPDHYAQTWLALDPRPSGTIVRVEWAFGMGCSFGNGTVMKNTIAVPDIRAVIVIHNTKHATIRYDDGTTRELTKTRVDVAVGCE